MAIIAFWLGGCQNNNAENKTVNIDGRTEGVVASEPFDEFYNRFTNDSVFQIQRINFPLPGINTDEMDISDKVYYWQKDQWIMYKGIPSQIDTADFQVKKIRSDSVAIDEVAQKNVSFGSKYTFKIKSGKWFLVYYEDINL
ncbi:DUF4348 domain-containing protein [Hymenobacter radiodurans]|uniref:DUF4348 domain-containing protein n=1 Tax=Hymenobacter radiodurans TaxID=2496028 RepID=UPI0014055A08|nr:DUF4348 domain-containing protein [Hymenobacter radiodurans]